MVFAQPTASPNADVDEQTVASLNSAYSQYKASPEAESGEQAATSPKEGLDEKSIIKFAEKWAESFASGKNLKAGEIIGGYNGDEELIGYSVNYLKDNQPHGNIMLDLFDEENPVSTFSVEPKAVNFYETIKSDSLKRHKNLKEKPVKKIYSTMMDEYDVKFEADGKDVYVDNLGEEQTPSQYSAKKKMHKQVISDAKTKYKKSIQTQNVPHVFSEAVKGSAGDAIFNWNTIITGAAWRAVNLNWVWKPHFRLKWI